ncbi:MAG: choice-of-anchor Q domain-containing protein [Terriglobales bacterium]
MKTRKTALQLVFSLLLLLQPMAALAANTYYVDSVACDDTFPGSATQPWCTIGHAASIMLPGDIVIVRPGTYHESVVPKSGTASAYITYQGQKGAVLDGTGTTAQAFDINNVAYLNIGGFEVTNYKNPRPAGNSVNIHGTSNHIVLSNMLVHDNWNGIIMQDSANQIAIGSSEVYNSRYGVGFENTVHDIVIDSVISHNNSELYIGPVSSYQNGDGFSDDQGTSNLTITNSVAYGNQDAGFDIKAVNFSCTNCKSYNNVKYGFRMWTGGGPFTLVNALAYGNGWFPLMLQNLGPSTTLYNCTFVGGSGDMGYMIDQPASNLILRNTIFAGFTKGMSNGNLTAVNDDYDLYFPAGGTLGFTMGPHSFNADPMFVNPGGGDYHLQASSLAIDAGTTLTQVTTDLDGNPRPQGVAYDIGAYEFTGTAAPAVTVSVSPPSMSLQGGQSQPFTATVTGTSTKTVTWSLSAPVGLLSSTGVYSAPAVVAAAQTVTVKATSTVDTTKFGTATVTLVPVSVSVSPTSKTLGGGQSQPFTATVTGSGNTTVNWSMNPLVGSMSGNVYNAPASVTAQQTVTVTATSAADPSKFASATVTLVPVSITISPTSFSLNPGQSHPFTATVTGSSNTGVNWSATGGTVDGSGNYTAGTSTGTFSVTATSQSDTTKFATANVTISPASGTTTVVNFDSPACPIRSLTGTFGGINWSGGSWDCERANLGTGISVSWNKQITRGSFSFVKPSVFVSFLGAGGRATTVTVSTDAGESISKSLPAGMTLVTTGFTKPATKVTVTNTAGWWLQLDNITYHSAP